METSRNESVTLVAAIIGAAVLGNAALAIGTGAPVVGDIAILLTLFAFDNAPTRNLGQSMAYGGTGGFCLLTPFQVLANALSPAKDADRPYWTIAAIWLAATLLLFALDRFRMSSREPIGFAGTGLAGSVASSPMAFTPPKGQSFHPAPIRVQTAPPPSPTPYNQPVPTVVSEAVFPLASEEAPAASVMPSPVIPPQPAVTVIPPGREALIYLNLVGEGLNVLRTVRAENLGRDYYRIADIMPEGEQWEFTPGQVVRCRKKSLSNGKHMVAYEEAPRAQ